MATDKRARQRANRAKKIEQETRIERNTRIRNLVITGVVVIIGLGGLIYLLSLTGDDDDLAVTPTETEVTLESTTTTTELEIPAVSAPEPGGTLTGTPDCPAEDGSSDRITQFDQAPPTCIDQSATYRSPHFPPPIRKKSPGGAVVDLLLHLPRAADLELGGAKLGLQTCNSKFRGRNLCIGR